MEETKQEMGLINNLAYGLSGKGVGTLIEIKLLSGVATIFLNNEETTDILTKLQLSNIMALKLKPCVVSIDKDRNVIFEGLV